MTEPKTNPFDFLKKEKYNDLRNKLENNRLRNLTESMMLDYLAENESALIKRNEELEAMLEKCKSLFDQRQLPYERDCVEFSKEITGLLNKPK